MTKLHQLLAIEKGEKTRANRDSTDIHKRSLKAELFQGRVSTYRPFDEENGEKQPDKHQLVQLRADEVLSGLRNAMTRIFDITATRDVANKETKATVVVDSKTIMEDVPVSFLIYMEKSLDDEETALRKLPTLPTNVEWKWDDNRNLFVTEPAKSYRSAKIDKVIVKSDATKEHPAQVDIRPADVQVGEWTTTQFSGAIPAKRKAEILARIVKLKEAVKFAREEANGVEVKDVKVGKALFDYIFDGE